MTDVLLNLVLVVAGVGCILLLGVFLAGALLTWQDWQHAKRGGSRGD